MAEKEFDPSSPSSVYLMMADKWQLIRDVRAGASAVRAAGEKYLPKFNDEDTDEYRKRVKVASFTALYEDSTRTLASKPFSKPVSLQGTIPPDLDAWKENIDLSGNNLHVYASNVFTEAIHMGACYIFVDQTRPAGAVNTMADERAAGIRPFFRTIPVDDMLAIYDGVRDGKTYIRQIRFKDNSLELDDMEERIVERVRVIDDYGTEVIDGRTGIYQRVFQKYEDGWKENVDLSGPIGSPTMREIPLVPVLFGLPEFGRFGVKPTMYDLADKQIEHYRHLNRIDQTFDFAGFPMLQAEGMAPPMTTDAKGNRIPVRLAFGPRSVLFAPPNQAGDRPRWSFVEPSAQSIKEMREHKKDIESEMRTLGLQPHMPSQGIQNMAATTSAINAARTHSAVQAWAMKLQDALAMAFVFMARWRGLPETTNVFVHTDFSAEVLKDADEKMLVEMVTLGLISRETFYDEMTRRDILGPQFDKATEYDKIETEGLNGTTGNGIEDEGGTEDDPTGTSGNQL